jgi:hypothetical protein
VVHHRHFRDARERVPYAKMINMTLTAGQRSATPYARQRFRTALVAILAIATIGLLVRVGMANIGVVWTLVIGWLCGTVASVGHITLRSRIRRHPPSER